MQPKRKNWSIEITKTRKSKKWAKANIAINPNNLCTSRTRVQQKHYTHFSYKTQSTIIGFPNTTRTKRNQEKKKAPNFYTATNPNPHKSSKTNNKEV